MTIDISNLKIYVEDILRFSDGINILWKLNYKERVMIYYSNIRVPYSIDETDNYYIDTSFQLHKSEFKKWMENIENEIYIGKEYYNWSNPSEFPDLKIFVYDIIEDQQNGIKIVWKTEYNHQTNIFDSSNFIPFSPNVVTYGYYLPISFEENKSMFINWMNNISPISSLSISYIFSPNDFT